jgi:hypothetical protein
MKNELETLVIRDANSEELAQIKERIQEQLNFGSSSKQ